MCITANKEMRVFVGLSDYETVLNCEVSVDTTPAEARTHWHPGFDAGCEVTSIMCEGQDITWLFDRCSDAMNALAKEIVMDASQIDDDNRAEAADQEATRRKEAIYWRNEA